MTDAKNDRRGASPTPVDPGITTEEFLNRVWQPGMVARRQSDGSIVVEEEHPAARAARAQPVRPRRGRPEWTKAVFLRHWAKAYQATSPPRTLPRIAENFRALNGDMGIDVRALRRLRRRAEQGELD